VDGHPPGERPGLTELLAATSLATDLVTGQPLEHALRTCLLSVHVGRRLGLHAGTLREVHSVALLRFLGCTADAPEMARLAGGDNIALMAAMGPTVMGSTTEDVAALVRSLGRDLPLPRRVVLLARALADPRGAERSLSAHCEVGARLAARLGLGLGVVHALSHAYERWDGRGLPDGLAGTAIPLPVRVVVVARDVVLWQRVAGNEAALEVLRRRRGRAYDPAVVDAVLTEGLPADAGGSAWDDVLRAEPEPVLRLDPGGLDRVLAALGDFADLRSRWTVGRSGRVARLAAAAAEACGLRADDVTVTRHAGTVADLGAVGVPGGVWASPGPLGVAAAERLRLHPYLTERVLGRCSGLRPVAAVAGAHHERLDGSGYHRGSAAPLLPPAARILAAADVWCALGEDRAHRPGRATREARAVVADEVTAGRLDREAVRSVLEVAGAGSRNLPERRPAGLSDREIEVLRLLARGSTNRQVASRLAISPKTVGRHVEHIYAKAGLSSRAAAALFAVENGLLD
jgi:HD-GYP domain-containing protein (c-di-GMP phosphodiesterase class II)